MNDVLRKREWEAHTRLRDGFACIVFADGEQLIIKNDGVTGYEFVANYLAEMQEHYKGHLVAADAILRKRLGSSYRAVRNVPTRYQAELALVSLNCCFGMEDAIPDHEHTGRFNPEFCLCPERYNCPFNGYQPNCRGKYTCCNPIYEIGLTRLQAQLAERMVQTDLSYEELARELGCSYANIDAHRRKIFAKVGVKTRQELTLKLQGKRLY